MPSHLGKNERAVHRYLDAIRDEAARRGLVALGQPADFFLGPPAFFNTFYHLNEEGRTARTARVLRELGPRL